MFRTLTTPLFCPAFPTNQSIVDGNLLSLSIEVKDADGLSGAVLSEITPSWLTVDGSALNSTGYFRDANVTLRGTPAVSDEGPIIRLASRLPIPPVCP